MVVTGIPARRARAALLTLSVVCSPVHVGCEPAPLRAPEVSASVATTAKRPDVILVMMDTVRTDHLGLFGYAKPISPALDALSEIATIYGRAYAQSSWTAPSVASLLTSRYPRELGVGQHPNRLPRNARTLPRVLREHGYQTLGVSTNLFISSRYGYETDFDRFDERWLSKGAKPTSSWVTNRALDFLREARQEDPIFLYAHYFDPHYDYVLHRDFDAGAHIYGPNPTRTLSFLGQKLRPELGEWDMLVSRRNYDSEIAYMDHHIGRLISGLKGLGRFDNAVVVVVADHGEEFLDHGSIGHGATVYDELIHVPLLIKAPGQTQGAWHEAPVALLDVAPTIVDLSGLSEEPRHLGTSLREGRQANDIFAATFRPTAKIALVRGRHKAIIDYQANDAWVFDLWEDPYEQHSIAAEHPELTASLLWQLERWHEGEFEPSNTHAVPLTQGEKALLRALGYGE